MQVLKTVEKILYAADSTEAKEAMASAQEEYGVQLLCPSPQEGGAAEEPVAVEAQ